MAIILATGCAYHVQTLANSRLSRESWLILPFVEEVPLGLSGELAQSLVARLAASGVSLSRQTGSHVAQLRGSLTSAVATSATRSGIEVYNLVVTANVELAAAAGEVLWQNKFVSREEFLPIRGEDVQPMLTETNRTFAAHRVAQQLATQIHDGLLQWQAIQNF